jgi:hypothetical protein
MDTPPRPRLSLIVPARQAEELLPRSLGALLATDLPRQQWELIVVVDVCPDATAEVAARYADRVIRLKGAPAGPAFARNRGCEAARGEILVFIDADVCVHPSTLRLIAEVFTKEPEVGAVFGAYDTRPAAAGVVSQYRNLLHHYVHAQNPGEAETFWTGCGAVRRDAFLRVGGFDAERFPRPQIEDVDLGYRLRAAGCRILLRPEIQCTHLKTWTLPAMIVTDLRDRGIPWTLLALRSGSSSRRATLNLKPREKVCTALVGLAGLLALTALALQSLPWLALAAVPVAGMLGLNAPLLRWFARERGVAFALAVVPLRVLYYCINGLSAASGWILFWLAATADAREPARIEPVSLK